METYSLFKLNEYIRRVIALNFDDTVWINAEISQVSLSRGNYYLQLIEKEEGSDRIIAQASAIIWNKKTYFLRRKFNDLFDSILDTGNEIRVKIKVDFSERYGLSLVIEDLDASYTLGKAELVKQEILQRLQKENLIERNGMLTLPLALQRIAVISSGTAAGYKDFLSHLQKNSYGYHFDTTLFASAMQGSNVEHELIAALDAIEDEEKTFDCVVIIRGGGSKLDLAAFDNYEIAKRIANAKYPIITGIGHDIDSSITDLVSHTDVKTPTAVADFIIERSLHLESRFLDIGLKIQIALRETLNENAKLLESKKEQLVLAASMTQQRQFQHLNEFNLRLENESAKLLVAQSSFLDSVAQQVELLSPQNVLNRGFSILRQNGRVLNSVKNVVKDADLEVELADGKLRSKLL